MLKHANFDHEIAENGLRAVEMWEKGNYDLILMDVQMPGQDGFAATGAIREQERERGGHTLIVAMTAHAFPEDEKRCLDAGMDAYIPKPIDLQQCIATIEGANRQTGPGSLPGLMACVFSAFYSIIKIVRQKPQRKKLRLHYCCRFFYGL